MKNMRNIFLVKRFSLKLIRFLVFYLVVALLTLFSYPQLAKAASLTALSDTMSRLKSSTVSDHTIRFTTSTGAGDVGDTIIITMPDGFTIGSVDTSDIDLSHGVTTGYETEEGLAAVATSTLWGAAFSSQILTFTHPTDGANGDIAAADKVIVEIGLNAASGDQQITNQSSANTYIIDIAGTFGDSGKIGIVIITDDQVVVSTTIDPTLTFVITTNTVTLTKSGGGNPDSSNTGFNEGAANTLAASTNGDGGYSITYNGATLTGANTIDAMAAKTTSSTGTEQFGINLKDNATPNTGAEPSGGSGTPAADYNTADQFRFITGTTTDLASASAPSDTTTFTVTYIVNVSGTTEAEVYTTTITYICTGNF